jgi:hypothetical protein
MRPPAWWPAGSGPRRCGQLGSDAFRGGLALRGLPGLVAVVAEHPAQVGRGVEVDLLDPQVVPHLARAALPGEDLLDVRRAGGHPLPG